MEYVPLQLKTSYSMLESLNNIKPLVKYASSLGYQALAITDQYLFGVMEFYQECQKNNIKPLIGLTIEIENNFILLYAKNNKGYKNLIKLSEIVSEQNINIDILKQYSDNLILIMPIKCYNTDIYAIYPDHYLGYSTLEEKQIITEKNGVLITDVRYLLKNDYEYLDYLSMIKNAKKYGEYPLHQHKGHHLLTKDEVDTLCDTATIRNTKKIVDSCHVTMEKQINILPTYDENINAKEYLAKLSQKGLSKRLKNNIPAHYQARLEYELEVIDNMGFSNYFLIVYDYVKYAKQNGILVGPGRGSACGSLVSYAIGITDIDPIQYNLLFERFLNKDRITMPDIDIDFESNKREQVINYVVEKYGTKKVSGIITFSTMSAKQIIKDLAKVLSINNNLASSLSKLITKNDLRASIGENQKLRKIINTSQEIKKMFEIALKLENLPRHISVNAAGIVISNTNLDEIIPLYKNETGLYLTGYSKNYLEDIGLLKMDFLGINNLTIISDILALINNNNEPINFNNIPLDDLETYEIFQNGDTDGIFQFESSGMKKFLVNLHPDNKEDLIAAIALYRPGPFDNINKYIKRKKGQEKVTYLDDCLVDILKRTYGIIIYQEQIMQIANLFAGYTYSEADIFRRAMSKKDNDLILKEQDKFMTKALSLSRDKNKALEIFNEILKFASYGFNLSHSVAYTTISYKMAYLKKHYLVYFTAVMLENNANNKELVEKYLFSLRKNNIEILPPDINQSTDRYQVVANKLLCSFNIINNIERTIANEIIRNRKTPYLDFTDFVCRNYSHLINEKVITVLIKAGCFNKFNNKRTLIENLVDIINYAKLIKEENLPHLNTPIINYYDEYSSKELIDMEISSYNFYLSSHPITKYKNENSINTPNINHYYNQKIEIILLINYIKEVITKNNDVMAFFNTSDEYGHLSLTLFKDTYSKYRDLKVGDIIRVRGLVTKRYDEYQINVENIQKEGETCQNYPK